MRNKATHISQVPPEKGHYVAGFVDGEGSFHISARRRGDYPSGWRLGLHFNVSNCDKMVLEICKRHLGCGTIRESRTGLYTLEVRDRRKLKGFVVPFFRRFGFLSNKKQAEFRIFQGGLTLLESGIRRREELESFLLLRSKLNALRRARITNTDAAILESFVLMGESSET